MPAAIKLMRIGKKNQPSYRIIVVDKRRPRNSRYLENIGYYNPNTNPPALKINKDRYQYWLNNGAVISSGIQKLRTQLKRI